MLSNPCTGMSSYFWIGGALDAASAWTWLDGRPMAMGEPFWGLVSFFTVKIILVYCADKLTLYRLNFVFSQAA